MCPIGESVSSSIRCDRESTLYSIKDRDTWVTCSNLVPNHFSSQLSLKLVPIWLVVIVALQSQTSTSCFLPRALRGRPLVASTSRLVCRDWSVWSSCNWSAGIIGSSLPCMVVDIFPSFLILIVLSSRMLCTRRQRWIGRLITEQATRSVPNCWSQFLAELRASFELDSLSL